MQYSNLDSSDPLGPPLPRTAFPEPVTFASPPAPVGRTKWTPARAATLGRLVAQGFDAKQVSEHPEINTTPNNVYRQAQRLGLKFREHSGYVLSPQAFPVFDQAAISRGTSVPKLVTRILDLLAEDITLLDNVIDDGKKTFVWEKAGCAQEGVSA